MPCRRLKRTMRKTMNLMTARTNHNRPGEAGMTLLAVMALMTLTAIALLAAAPVVQQQVQREKELEAIRRGEEVAEAIRQYVVHYNGARLPDSIDDLLEGLPQGTKTRQILRPSAAIDPLSPDGKWRLIKPEPDTLAAFARRVQNYNNGALPSNTSQILDRYSILIVNSLSSAGGDGAPDDDDFDVITDNAPFIGVASQSRARSVLTYYGIEKHSSWIFTPLFRGNGTATFSRPGSTSGPGTSPGTVPRPPRPPRLPNRN